FVRVINFSLSCNTDPCTQLPGRDQGYNNITLTPYMTGLSPTSGKPGVTAQTWYDELIVSTQPIAVPARVTSAPPNGDGASVEGGTAQGSGGDGGSEGGTDSDVGGGVGHGQRGPDAMGPAVPPSSGTGCRAAGARPSEDATWLIFGVVALLARRLRASARWT